VPSIGTGVGDGEGSGSCSNGFGLGRRKCPCDSCELVDPGRDMSNPMLGRNGLSSGVPVRDGVMKGGRSRRCVLCGERPRRG
jgi:hypothetical protein